MTGLRTKSSDIFMDESILDHYLAPAPRRSWPCVTTCSPFSNIRDGALGPPHPHPRCAHRDLRPPVVISGLTTKRIVAFGGLKPIGWHDQGIFLA